MKIKNRVPFSFNEYKKAVPPPFQQVDILKWLAFAISILGIQAWIAGTAFESGYWAISGLEGPFITKSLQQTALTGFIGPAKIWGYASLAAVAIGILLSLIAIKKKKSTKSEPQRISSLKAKLAQKFEYDKPLGLFGVKLICGGYAFWIFIILPLLLWGTFAYCEGRDLFKKQACNVRAGIFANTQMNISENKIIKGRIIDRSEGLIAINDGFSIHVFTNKEKPSLIYSIALPLLECKND